MFYFSETFFGHPYWSTGMKFALDKAQSPPPKTVSQNPDSMAGGGCLPCRGIPLLVPVIQTGNNFLLLLSTFMLAFVESCVNNFSMEN